MNALIQRALVRRARKPFVARDLAARYTTLPLELLPDGSVQVIFEPVAIHALRRATERMLRRAGKVRGLPFHVERLSPEAACGFGSLAMVERPPGAEPYLTLALAPNGDLAFSTHWLALPALSTPRAKREAAAATLWPEMMGPEAGPHPQLGSITEAAGTA